VKALTNGLLAKLCEIARAMGEAHVALAQGDGDTCVLKLNDVELGVRAAREELKHVELRLGLSSSAHWMVSATLH
jgi:hypothetical protein